MEFQGGNYIVVSKFLKKEVRKTFYNNEWWFSIVDVIESLTESVNPSDYWYQLKKKMKIEEGSEVSTIYRKLKLPAKDGKNQPTDCSNIEGVLRITQSVPSKNAEPFKRWLARVGFERLEEIKDPSKAYQRVYGSS